MRVIPLDSLGSGFIEVQKLLSSVNITLVAWK